MKSILLITLFITSLYALKGDIMLTDSLNPQAQFSWPVDIGKVTDMQLYDMLARYFGAPRNQAINNGNQLNLNIDLFNRPSGNLLFSVSGLSSSKMPQNGLKVMGSTPLVDLIPSVQSTAGHYGILAGVLTGNENNGVETEKTIPAGKDIYAKSMGNFYDALSKLYPQKQMVSASSSLEGAMVLSPHLKNFGSQVKSMYWEKRQKSFVSVSEASSFSIGVKDFPALMKTLATVLGKPVKYNEIEQTVSVAGVEYDLSCEATEALFAEVLFVANMAQHPVSFFSFHFQGLSLISAKFSTQSSEYEMAVRMIDAVIAYIQSTYSQHHTLQMTILYFNDNSHTQEVISAIEPILVNKIDIPFGKGLIGTITHDLPYIFLSPEGKSKIGEICDELTYVVADYDLSVECSINLKRSILQTPEPQPNPSPSPSPSPDDGGNVASPQDVALVHIVLWLVIALIAALLQSCYHLSVLDGSNEPEFKPKTYEGAGVRSKTTKIQ